MDFHVFIISNKAAINNGDLPETLEDEANADTPWSFTGWINRFGGHGEPDTWKSTAMRVHEHSFYGRTGFSFRLIRRWNGGIVVCDREAVMATCEGGVTTSEAVTTSTEAATTSAPTTTTEASTTTVPTTTGWFCCVVNRNNYFRF